MNSASQPQPKADKSEDDTDHMQASIVDDLQRLRHDLAKVFTGSFDLIVLEARLAAVSLAWLIALGLVAGVILISVWALLMAALGLWLASHGITVEMALLGIAVINIAISVFLWVWMRRISHNLTFKASRQHLFNTGESRLNDID